LQSDIIVVALVGQQRFRFCNGAKVASAENSGLASLLRYLPVIQNAVRKVHQDLTAEQLENGLTFDDFNALFNAMLEVSGLKKAAAGEPTPVPV
jgi:hypothetical protein